MQTIKGLRLERNENRELTGRVIITLSDAVPAIVFDRETGEFTKGEKNDVRLTYGAFAAMFRNNVDDYMHGVVVNSIFNGAEGEFEDVIKHVVNKLANIIFGATCKVDAEYVEAVDGKNNAYYAHNIKNITFHPKSHILLEKMLEKLI